MHFNDKSISRKSKNKHVQTPKHDAALAVWNVDTVGDVSGFEDMPTLEPAMLMLAHRLRELEKPTIPDFPAPAQLEPFSDIYKDRTGTYIDLDGQEILFSAGPNQEDEQRARFKRLVQQMNTLDLLSHHTVLGNFEDSNGEPDDELDVTVLFGA